MPSCIASAPGKRGRKRKTSEPPAPEPAQASFQIPDAVVEQAGLMVIAQTVESGWNGRTVADIAGDPEYGHAWLVWALTDGSEQVPEDQRAAIALWLQQRLPDVWEQVS